MKNLYPMKLSPVAKTAIWGGNKLSTEYGIKSDAPNVAEAWLLTVRENEMSIVENGEFSGKTLGEVLNSEGTSLIGKNFSLDRFPLLIKFIDAKDDLSIQVHPDNDYALKNENEFGKTEMWHIVEAEPDAKIVYGLKSGLTPQDFEAAVNANDYESVLNYVNVKKGDTFYIPSGLIHAICKGILIAEIQQNSDVTYRVYDYGRIGNDEKPRELHTKKALESVVCHTDEEIENLRYSIGKSSDDSLLAMSEYFTVKKYDLSNEDIECEVCYTSFASVICTSGYGKIISNGSEYEIKKGESYFLPAGLGKYIVSTEHELSLIISKL